MLNLYVDNRTQEILGDISIVRHVITNSLFTFQPIKLLASMTVRSAKQAVTCLMFRSSIKKQTVLFGEVGTHCFAEKTSGDYGG